MTFKPDLKLREQVFRKMGARIREPFAKEHVSYSEHKFWVMKDSMITRSFVHVIDAPQVLPPIETSWEVCAEYLVPFMLPRGWEWNIDWNGDNKKCFMWSAEVPDIDPTQHDWIIVEKVIQNDNIALAACQAFLQVEL